MANNTMEAIKKKMQAMKVEKENAFDKAEHLDQKLSEQKVLSEKVSRSGGTIYNYYNNEVVLSIF